MSPQIAGLRGCKTTLVAFVWLFSTVRFQMCPQITCLNRCIVALVTFVWLFSTVCLQMSPQIACQRGCIITELAFFCLFSTLHFQMYPQMRRFFSFKSLIQISSSSSSCTIYRWEQLTISFSTAHFLHFLADSTRSFNQSLSRSDDCKAQWLQQYFRDIFRPLRLQDRGV